MINVLSEITQTREQRACHFKFRMLVQYHWVSEDLSYHSSEHYYLNVVVKTWKSLTYLQIHFYHLRLDIVLLLETKKSEFWEGLEISVKKMDNACMIWTPERNIIGTWFYKPLLLSYLRLNHSSWIYIY